MTTLQELARLVDGTVVGDGSVAIRRIAPIDQADEGDLTFVSNPKYLSRLQQTQASAVIVAPGVDGGGRNLLVCANPYLAFARILTFLQQGEQPEPGIRPGAYVDDSAELGPEVAIFPGAYVGPHARIGRGSVLHPGVVVYDEAVVGEDCLLYANAVVRERCRLGDRVILQPGAIIGSDGFGYAPDGAAYVKIPQVGIVELEDDVEIGACACIDRAALGVTRIRRGCKLDNLVQVGHNVDLGEDGILVAQVGIAGSTRIGRHCTFGGQAGVAGHITVGDQVMLGARGTLTGNTEGKQILSGAPGIPHRQWLKASTVFARLPEMQKELAQLKKRLDDMEQGGHE